MTRTSFEPSNNSASQSEPTAVAVAASQGKQRFVVACLTMLLLVLFAVFASNVRAQQNKFEVLPVEPVIDNNLPEIERKTRVFMTSNDISTFPANELAVLQRYYRDYIPAKITQPDALHQINDVMAPAYAIASRAMRAPNAGTKKAMEWLYIGLKRVATGNYQIPARVNAITFISKLSSPGQRGLPVPYRFILTDMRDIYVDANNPDGVRAAALQGLERYARFTPVSRMDKAALADVKQAMNDLLQSTPPSGRSELAHAFLQRYAVSILTYVSEDASIGKQLVSISTDDQQPNLIGLHSAAAIGGLPGKLKPEDVKSAEVLKKWAGRLSKAYQSEIDRLDRMEKKQQSQQQPAPPESFVKQSEEASKPSGARRSADMEMMMNGGGSYDEMMEDPSMGYDMDAMMGGMMGGSMMGGGMMRPTEKPQPPEVTASRKKLNYAMQQIVIGLTGKLDAIEDADSVTNPANITGGLLAAIPQPELEDTKPWLTAMIDIQTALNDKSVGSAREFSKKLQEQVDALNALAEGRSVVKKATVEQPLFFGAPSDDAPAPPADGSATPDAAAGDAGLEALMNQ
ncbi:hypothetical protein LOC67_21715 [Stieleria sp. JC731]|uniref:hypothetical protein n=1 Tax=Pirellulaceae TaxID=2691357 RepID=UPI001E3E10D5|nr:hypothetical protein [Stieleria sp. JC731]MCC9603176.1 hypothetical protein [Stieleria sp. JC731]